MFDTAAPSSFDAVLATADTTSTKSPDATDTTNQQGSDDLLKGLMTALTKGQQSNQDTKQEGDEVDYSALFGITKEVKPAADEANKPDAKPPASASTKTAEPAPNAFITQLNDESLMSKWVAAQQVTPIRLDDEALKSYQDESGELVFSPETLGGIMTQAANVALQQSATQTISFLRELIPALTETAQAEALSALTSKQNKTQVINAFEGNKPLQQLADSLVKDGTASDPAAAVAMVNKLMHDINTQQSAKLVKDNPKAADKSISTFLQNM